jgi:NAD-dependent SIR2 family protein deacetylase
MQLPLPTSDCDFVPNPAATRLAEWLSERRRVTVLTGAGCSAASGIPVYRDDAGRWMRKPPVQFAAFIGDAVTRARYWARSLAGWERFAGAQPNDAHAALARLQAAGRVDGIVTQNVDGLHQRAGSRAVVDLHGRLDQVQCLDCGASLPRAEFQALLAARNPDWAMLPANMAPDGDADLENLDFAAFDVPACAHCGGIVKPAVVFFGEAVPPGRAADALARATGADALLVVGSSLMVWSGFRLVRAAAERGIPVAALNLGDTRADALLSLKVSARCDETLPALAEQLAA